MCSDSAKTERLTERFPCDVDTHDEVFFAYQNERTAGAGTDWHPQRRGGCGACGLSTSGPSLVKQQIRLL